MSNEIDIRKNPVILKPTIRFADTYNHSSFTSYLTGATKGVCLRDQNGCTSGFVKLMDIDNLIKALQFAKENW